MTPARRLQIAQIVTKAAGLQGKDLEYLLDQECGADSQLRDQVKRNLTIADQTLPAYIRGDFWRSYPDSRDHPATSHSRTLSTRCPSLPFLSSNGFPAVARSLGVAPRSPSARLPEIEVQGDLPH